MHNYCLLSSDLWPTNHSQKNELLLIEAPISFGWQNPGSANPMTFLVTLSMFHFMLFVIYFRIIQFFLNFTMSWVMGTFLNHTSVRSLIIGELVKRVLGIFISDLWGKKWWFYLIKKIIEFIYLIQNLWYCPKILIKIRFLFSYSHIWNELDRLIFIKSAISYPI